MKLKSEILLWKDNQGRNFCEFTLDREDFEKLGVKIGDEIKFMIEKT